ncbi:MAG: 50S ribosomal protein L17 [Chloroflexi bacterium]|nr:50S ribosomal protein L17 [Chloroflexota bacterium]MDL1883443.1 50S ribosomal protein L17 [Anaerolineae bacterium CFX8]NWG17813.1 50S ribosomal protein L17 [Chloroflexota bacterium]
MRHRVRGKKLGRNGAQRKTLRLSLATALLEHGRIKTTRAKADFIRSDVEKLITLAKRSRAHEDPNRVLHAQRIAASRLNNNRDLVSKLFNNIAPRYENRPGGYTRILKLGQRQGDAAEMVLLELVEREE